MPALGATSPSHPEAIAVDAEEGAGIAALVQGASVEINHADVKHLEAARTLLPSRTRLFISHLPGQTWQQTIDAAAAATAHGFAPVPHIPVRLMPDAATFDRVVGRLADRGATELLLISGDYAQAVGPFDAVAPVLATGVLGRHGIRRVSLAGHPEGHPKVDTDVIRRAQRDKVRQALDLGLQPTLVTQFFFESAPFLQWCRELREDGIDCAISGGIAAPASIATLFKYAMRCGVGPSIRALGAKPSSVLKLLGDYGPEPMIRAMVDGVRHETFNGLHLYCFGGFLRACRWLNAMAQGRITMTQGGFSVNDG